VFGLVMCVKVEVAKLMCEEENEEEAVMNWFIRKQSWLKLVLNIVA